MAWTDGEVRPTSRPAPRPKRGRRRPDPLEKVTDQLRTWFDAEPWVTSRQLLEQLQEEHPGLYPDSLLRTLQRRVKIWRQERVQEVIFGSPAIESAPREDHAHADAIAAPEFETAQRRVPGVMERKRRQAATAGRTAVAACGPDHTPRTGFQNHRVFGNILDEAKVQPRVTFLSEAIRAAILIDALEARRTTRKPSASSPPSMRGRVAGRTAAAEPRPLGSGKSESTAKGLRLLRGGLPDLYGQRPGQPGQPQQHRVLGDLRQPPRGHRRPEPALRRQGVRDPPESRRKSRMNHPARRRRRSRGIRPRTCRFSLRFPVSRKVSRRVRKSCDDTINAF